MSSRRAQLIACLEKGLHYFSIGQFAEARAFWEKALELDPNNAQAREFMQYVSEEATQAPPAPSQPDPVEPPEDRRTGGRISRVGLLSEAPAPVPIANVAPPTGDGTAPVADLSTRHIDPYQEGAGALEVQAESLQPPPQPMAARPRPPAPADMGFLAPPTHNIEDLLVPASQDELDQAGQTPGAFGAGLMPPSLGSFTPLENGGMGLLDQSGAHPLFGDETSAPPAKRPAAQTPQPASQVKPVEPAALVPEISPTSPAPAPPPELPSNPPASSVNAPRDLSTRFMPVLPKQPPNPTPEPAPVDAPKRNSARSTLPPASSMPVIQNIEELAPSDSLSTPGMDAPDAPSEASEAFDPLASLTSLTSDEAPPAHTVPTNETDPSIHNGEEHRIELDLPEQAAPPKLSPDQIADLIDVSDASHVSDAEASVLAEDVDEVIEVSDDIIEVSEDIIEVSEDIIEFSEEIEVAGSPGGIEDAFAVPPSSPELASSVGSPPVTPPPIQGPPPENVAASWVDGEAPGNASHAIDGFEDTPSDEFPAAENDSLSDSINGHPQSASASFKEFSFDDDEVVEVDDADIFESDPDSGIGAAQEYGDPMESPTPSSEMTPPGGGHEGSYPHEGSQLEFTGLPEIPERSFQEAGQVISLDLQGTDEPYIQAEHSPILTYRNSAGEPTPAPESQATAHDAPSFQGDSDPFAPQDPFDQPHDDPFASGEGSTDRHANPFASSDAFQDPYGQTTMGHTFDPNDPYGATTTTPVSSSSVPAVDHYNSTAAYVPYGQTQDPYAQTANHYGQTQAPYQHTQAPYQQTQDPYQQTQAQNPYAQAQDPFGQAPDPFAQTPDPYAQTPDPYAQTPDPYAQTPDPYAQTPDPYAQTPDPYAQASSPQYEGQTDAYDPYNQALDPNYEAAANNYDPYSQTVSPQSYQSTAHDAETPGSGISAIEQPGIPDVLDLDHALDDDMFGDEPTPDAPMPSIHEQIAHLPSAALRHEYVEHETKAPPPPPPPAEELGEVDILLTGAKDLLAEEDYRSAIELLEMAKNQSPDHAEVLELYETCKAEVEKIYLSEITSLDLVPHVKCTMDEIMRLNIDHRVGFLISQIDGHTSLSDLIILTGFNENELVRVIGQLNDQGVIHLE